MPPKVRRNYQNDYPSVTTVLGVLRKPGLEMWFKMNTLKFILEKTSKAKTIGTQTHEAIENYINTGVAKVDTEYPDEVTFALKSFMKFRQEHPEISIKVSEVELTSEVFKYNGTLDAPQPPELFDWKTGEAKDKDAPAIWDEYKYQVAAYVYLWNEHHPDNPISRAVIVSVAKDKVGYALYIMEQAEIDECFHLVFCPALTIVRFQRRKKIKE